MIPAAQLNGEIGNVVVSTLALSIAAGGILMSVAKRMGIPGIVLLLFGGVILGPEGIGMVQPHTLGPTLNVMVAVAVGLILFEGGLTLDISGYRSAPRVIRNLLTIGVAVTWIGTALAIWLFFHVEPEFALLGGSLIIVTGPTVIQPILKRVRLKWNLHNILHWEGVLNDPIGVFLAILAYEWVVGGGGGSSLPAFSVEDLRRPAHRLSGRGRDCLDLEKEAHPGGSRQRIHRWIGLAHLRGHGSDCLRGRAAFRHCSRIDLRFA